MASTHRIYIGTYTRSGSKGIYASSVSADGTLGEPRLEAEAPNPTFLALSPGGKYLYAVCSGTGWASSYRVDPQTQALSPVQVAVPDAGPTPCHVSVNPSGTIALVAHYHLGMAAAIPLRGDGTLGMPRSVAHAGKGPHPVRQTSPHVHSGTYSPDGRFALLCDLGLDRVYVYRVDPESVSLVPANPPYVPAAPGAGPRHSAFSTDGRFAFVINELANTLVVYGYDAASGRLEEKSGVALLPPDFKGEATSAEVRVHPNGRFVYASVRGPDTLSVFALGQGGQLTLVETVPCGGRGPRGFTLSPDGAWLVCAHQDSNSLCSFDVDAETGRLSRVPGTRDLSSPVCVAFLD